MFGFPFNGGLNGDDFFSDRDTDFEDAVDMNDWDIDMLEVEEGCTHPNMESTTRTDYCPDCGYSFYYPSAH